MIDIRRAIECPVAFCPAPEGKNGANFSDSDKLGIFQTEDSRARAYLEAFFPTFLRNLYSLQHYINQEESDDCYEAEKRDLLTELISFTERMVLIPSGRGGWKEAMGISSYTDGLRGRQKSWTRRYHFREENSSLGCQDGDPEGVGSKSFYLIDDLEGDRLDWRFSPCFIRIYGHRGRYQFLNGASVAEFRQTYFGGSAEAAVMIERAQQTEKSPFFEVSHWSRKNRFSVNGCLVVNERFSGFAVFSPSFPHNVALLPFSGSYESCPSGGKGRIWRNPVEVLASSFAKLSLKPLY